MLIEVANHEPQEKPFPYVPLLRIGERRMLVIDPMMKTQQDRSVLVENLIEDGPLFQLNVTGRGSG